MASLAAALLPVGCVSLLTYDALQKDHQQLQTELPGDPTEITRSQGVNPNLLSAQGFGATNPVASNDTPEGRSKNRRIEVALVGSGN